MPRLHLVDATYELFRAFYGAPPHQTPAGREVGGALGLVRSLFRLIDDPETTHVACAFDHVIESFRNSMLASYKTGEGIDPILKGQFEIAEEAVRAAGFVVWPMIEFEADDALASAAHRWADDPSVSQVIICSPDKDLAQCVVGRRVVTLNRRSRVVLDDQGVREKYGVPPASIPDWLALVGDSADGIPGIPGWGAKSAAQVLSHYGRIEKIPDLASEWTVSVRGALRLATNLQRQRADAVLYRFLTTLRRDVPLEEDLGDLRWRGVQKQPFTELCREWGVDDLQP